MKKARVYVSQDIHKEMTSIYKKDYKDTAHSKQAKCYVVGTDDNNIARAIYPIDYTYGKQGKNKWIEGCWEMPRVDSNQLTKSMLKCIKDSLNPTGIARIGNFSMNTREGLRGTSLRDMMKSPNAYMISVSAEYNYINKGYELRCKVDYRKEKEVEMMGWDHKPYKLQTTRRVRLKYRVV